MAYSSKDFCIPPDVIRNGEVERVRGCFTVRLLSSSWVLPRSIPANLEALLCLSSDRQFLLPLPLHAGNSIDIPIVSSPATFNRYLRDLQSLHIAIRNVADVAGEPFASCVLCLNGLNLDEAQVVNLPVHAANTRCLGHLEILLEATFSSSPSQHVGIETKSESAVHHAKSTDFHAEEVLDQIENSVNSRAKGEDATVPPIKDLLSLVHAAVQRRTWQAVSAFRQLDHNKSGKLDADDSVRCIAKILPFPLPLTHMCYLRFMLDVSGTREFTFQLLTSSLRDCKEAALLCWTSQNRHISRRLSNAAFDIQQRTLELGKLFRQRSQTEELNIPEIVNIVVELVSDWDEQLQRILLTKAYHLLPELADKASLGKIKHVFRTIILEQSQPTAQLKSQVGSQVQQRADACIQRQSAVRLGTKIGDMALSQVSPTDAQAGPLSKALSNDPTITNFQTRRSLRTQTHSSQTFETEYNEICTLLEACRQASPGPRQHRRQGNRTPSLTQIQSDGSKPECVKESSKRWRTEFLTTEAACGRPCQKQSMHAAASCCTEHVPMDNLACSSDIIEILMRRALQLKEMLTKVASSVQSADKSRSICSNTGEQQKGFNGRHSGQKARDVADLATLKALTASTQSVACSARECEVKQEVANCSTEPGRQEHGDRSSLEPKQTPAQHPLENVRSRHASSNSCQSDSKDLRDHADVIAGFTVSQLNDIAVSGSVRKFVTSASQPALWLACRMPGSLSVRPWLMLTSLSHSALQMTDKESFSVNRLDVSAETEVFMATSNLRAIRALGQPMTIQCEMWLLDGADPNEAMNVGHSSLIGLLAVPLHMQVLRSRNIELARGIYKVRNVLEGFTGAQVHICITASAKFTPLLTDVLPRIPPPGHSADATNSENTDFTTCADKSSRSHIPQESTAACYTVNHEFKVHILSIALPVQQDAAAFHWPVARYLKYTFPCDDQPLYTQDIPVQESHQFEDATFALHRIGLPQGAPILKHLVSEASSGKSDVAHLTFEVYDCFEEAVGMDDAVCFKGTLSIAKILEAARIDAPGWGQASSISTAQSMRLGTITCQNRFDVLLCDVRDCPTHGLPQREPNVSIDVQYTYELMVPHAEGIEQ